MHLIQEARAASALDHPNLCTVYEVGDAPEGQLFIAMACYDGETLRKLDAKGPLAVVETLDIAPRSPRGSPRRTAGIVHRDVKPANLMVTADGVVKILDFGIATLVAGPARPVRAPASHLVYMSPEQTRRGHSTSAPTYGPSARHLLDARREGPQLDGGQMPGRG